MEEKLGDEPAFPWGEHGQIMGGMTLRDYFAAKALPALIEMTYRLNNLKTDEGGPVTEDALAKQAYHFADAMIKARGEA